MTTATAQSVSRITAYLEKNGPSHEADAVRAGRVEPNAAAGCRGLTALGARGVLREMLADGSVVRLYDSLNLPLVGLR